MVAKISEHPEIGAKFAQVIAMSSLLETRLSGLLAMISGGGAEVTLAMFLAVNSVDAQRAMLRSAAEVALKGPEQEALIELLDDYRSRARERNKIAHGIWVTSPDVADALLLVRSADMAAYNKEFARHAHISPLDPLPDEFHDLIWRNCMIYRVQDFDDIFSRLVAYDSQIMQFWMNMVTARQEDAASAVQGSLPLDVPDPAHPLQEG
jgi:hypothetical protein